MSIATRICFFIVGIGFQAIATFAVFEPIGAKFFLLALCLPLYVLVGLADRPARKPKTGAAEEFK